MSYLDEYRQIVAFDDLFAGVHLQWFAPEDEGRTEDPTDRKIRKAREDGKVAKSGDVTSAVVMLFGLMALLILGQSIVKVSMDMLRYFISIASAGSQNSSVAITAVGNYLLRLSLPVMAVCFLAAFLGNLVQVGFLFSTKPITPDLSKIAPNFGKWAQKSFYSAEAAFNLFKSIAKVIIIAALAYVNIKSEIPELTNAVKLTVYKSLILVAGIAFRLMVEVAILLLAFALPDYFFQRHQHKESLKMSKHEIKEEYKETEGDPLIKSRLRQRMQEVLASSMVKQVPEADVVITNPTHFAVALKWDNQTMISPSVIAKGQDHMALRIKEIARDSDVTLVENRPLARALYDNVELGDEIPEDYWAIVAEVLQEVYRLSGRAV